MTLDLETTLLLSSAVQVVIAATVVMVGGADRPYPGLLQWKLSLSAAALVFVLSGVLFIPDWVRMAATPLALLVVPLQVDGLLQFIGNSAWRGWRGVNAAVAGLFILTVLLPPHASTDSFDLSVTLAKLALEGAIGVAVLLRTQRPWPVSAMQVLAICFAMDVLFYLGLCIIFSSAVASEAPSVNGSFLAAVTMISTVILPLKAFAIIAAKNQRTEAELRLISRDLEYQASTDALTKLRNRRSFYEQGHATVSLAQRHGRPLTALMVDIDRFKSINDSKGHAAGDKVLAAVAETMTRMLRTSDLIGRVGGEEFAILLVETPQRAGELTAERLRRGIASLRSVSPAFEGVTISIGLAPLMPDATGLDALLQAADEALYQAKKDGRDRWVAAA